MQELIAIKIQISKEEWKEEIDVLKKEIHRLESIIEKEDKKAKDIDQFLRKFIKANETKLVSRAHGMKGTSEVPVQRLKLVSRVRREQPRCRQIDSVVSGSCKWSMM